MFFQFPWIKKDPTILLEECWTLLEIGNFELWYSRSGIGLEYWGEEEDAQ